MTRKKPVRLPELHPAFLGVTVGVIAGILGAGGGFLIVPALLLMAEMPIKKAIGTSLLVIAGQSLVAFAGDSVRNPVSDWPLLTAITAAALVGMGFGMALSSRIESARLRPVFAWFLVLVAAGMIFKEFVIG
jgi:uncharacterized membrane protein YfcA